MNTERLERQTVEMQVRRGVSEMFQELFVTGLRSNFDHAGH